MTLLSQATTFAANIQQFLLTQAEPVQTGVGPVPVEETALANWVVLFAGGTAGGIAIILIIKGGYEILTSAGDPQKIQDGRETVTNAILGLILIFASTFILMIITRVLNIDFP